MQPRLKESCLSGRKSRTRNAVYTLRCTGGSNPSLSAKKKRVLLHKERSFLFEKAGPSLTTVGGSFLGESLERYALIIALTNPSLSLLILQFNPKAVSRVKVGKDDNTIFKERAQMLNDSLWGDTTQFSNLTYAMPLLEQYHRLKSC